MALHLTKTDKDKYKDKDIDKDKDKDKDKYKDKDSKYTLYTHNNALSPWSKTYFFKHNIQKAVILKEGSQ